MTRSPFLPFALPDYGEAEQSAVRDVLASGWITTGPKTKAFEAEFANAVGAKHAIAVSSCTAALHLALEAVGVTAGDEVITTPYTFAASAEVIRYFGATPRFVDVDRRTFNIDPTRAREAVTAKTKAILPVHIAGLSCDLDPLRELGLPIVEDAAHAFPSKYGGRTIGSIGDFTCFSFYATKTIATGEGGMLCTNDDAHAERCRIMSLHGISRDAWKRYTAEGSWAYDVIAPGFKYNLTDIASALGLAQLERAETMAQRRAEIAARYDDAFSSHLFEVPAGGEGHAWHLYMLRLQLDRWRIDRAAFIAELKARNIGTSVHFIPLHVQPYYRDLYGFTPESFPIAYGEYLREVSLPIYSRMTDDDVADVIDAVHALARKFA
ncbi:MAG TPA: DegT/DnrJ/EryC1/StrS aminotransferase family protein [Thermoanaerobaculia bacterium]|nr:DegT/DnrJ/EryC1/StrS aminotransferase family protein [Thermoanaerobaculia bacterium]